MSEREVEKRYVANPRGQTLVLDLYRVEGARAVALLSHGLGSSRRVQRMSRLARELNRRGIDAWVPDYPNHGNEASGGLDGLSFPHWVDDVRLLVEEARARYAQVFLFGHSLGGTVSLAAALEEQGAVAAVAVMSAPSWPLANPEYQARMEDWRARGYLLRFSEEEPRFLIPWRYAQEVLERYPRAAWEERLRRMERPLLVIHGSQDEVIPPAEAEHLAALVPGAELLLFESGHEWRNFSTQKRANRRVADFFAALLRYPAEERAPSPGSPEAPGAEAPRGGAAAAGGPPPERAGAEELPPAAGRRLRLVPGRFALLSLPPDSPVPAWAEEGRAGALGAAIRTREELTLVEPEEALPQGAGAARGWRALAVDGPLDLSEVGILAGLAVPLAEAGVPVFVLSTYQTDLLLVPEEKLAVAREALLRAGHRLAGEP
ncbi:MAG: alpha/beta fold hydrolase [Bacillota bacterium]|nr:alpha/beta fold hydrolase [Bacillota bacterium]